MNLSLVTILSATGSIIGAIAAFVAMLTARNFRRAHVSGEKLTLAHRSEAAHRATLEIQVRMLGIDHPDTLASRNNLATVLRDLGRPEEAAAEYRVVLDTQTQALGTDHPAALASRNNLATVLRDLGRPEEAAAEYRVVLDRSNQVLDADQAPKAAVNLGVLLTEQGNVQAAHAAFQLAIDSGYPPAREAARRRLDSLD